MMIVREKGSELERENGEIKIERERERDRE